MDALSLLTADHNRVRGLFARFEAAQEAEDVDAMAELAAQCVRELQVHTTIEEEIFYPGVKDTDEEISDLVDEGVQEHHVVDVLMEEMQALEPGTDEWVAKFTVLMENVEHHAEEEESELFPPLRSKLSAERLEQLADELEDGKRRQGAPVLADKIDLTKDELMALAREQEIPGRSTMDHDELAATVAPQT